MDKYVIVIEDSKDIFDCVSPLLNKNGYNVTSIDHPGSLEIIIDKQPSLILLDNRLGEGFGNTLCFSLKSNPLTRHIPVILVSTSNSIELIARSCQADGFLSKPFDPVNLIQVVNRFTEVSDTLI